MIKIEVYGIDDSCDRAIKPLTTATIHWMNDKLVY